MSVEDKLAEMRERCEAATEGPWGYGTFRFGDEPARYPCVAIGKIAKKDMSGDEFVEAAEKDCIVGMLRNWEGHLDATFIAHARTDMPALLAAVEELIVFATPTSEHMGNKAVLDIIAKHLGEDK